MIKNRTIKLAFLILLPVLGFYVYYTNRIYPGVKVAGIDIGGKTTNEALTELKQKVNTPSEVGLVAKIENQPDKTFKINLSSVDFSYDFKETVDKTYQMGRSGNIFFDASQILNSLTKTTNYGLNISVNEEKLFKNISVIAGQISIDPILPSIQLVDSNIVIQKGKAGTDVILQKIRVDIGESLSFTKNSPINIESKIIDPTLTDTQVQDLKDRAQKLLGKKIKITFEDQNLTYTGNDLINLISPTGGYDENQILGLIKSIADKVERDPQNAKFTFKNGVVEEFIPSKEGVKVKRDELRSRLIKSLASLESGSTKESSFDLEVEKNSPKIKTSDVNNLGIKELIGRGTSRFAGSIASRVHNVALAGSQLNGILVEPGQTFSFNDTIGDISAFTGYQQAYIIKDGKTVLGDGGGVCQVSTTLFRAAMTAGLPIIERTAHAYRVHYYEEGSPPGIDATVYSPTTDFKFKNDTPGYILIQTQTDLNNLVLTFELYGTNDGRHSTITTPIVTNITPPPPDEYTDDPSLPFGAIKQVDFSAWGADVKFDYKVERAGQILEDQTFYSNFRPWQARFLRGTKI